MKKRRLLSMVLSLCIVRAFMPQMAFADGTTDLQSLLNGGGTVTLDKDYTITSTLQVNNNVTLDLNGHVIKMTGSGSVIQVTSNANLTLQDSSPTAKHDGLPDGGVITGGNIRGNGGGVYVCNSSFEMTGGTIDNCSASGSGGEFVGGDGSFEMTGGTIDNSSASGSGGVFVGGDGSFEMTGGTIENGSASGSGGGVYVYNSSFTMTGGTISDCNAQEGNGVLNKSTLSANGGTIKDAVRSSGTIQNTSTNGGCTEFYGIVENNGTISGGVFYGGISGGSISGNTVTFMKDGIRYALEVVADGNKVAAPIEPTKEGYKFTGWYNGNTVYDFDQAVTEDITLTARWKDIVDPVITGLESQKTYCDTVKFEVSDNVGVASVTENGVPLTPDANNKYTLEKGKGTVTVVAKDNSDNETTVTVTVNNGHTGGEATCTSKAICEYCGEEYGELDSSNHDLDNIPANDATVTETGNREYWHCLDCGKYFSDKDGKNLINPETTVIAKLPPEITKGKGKSITAGEKKALSFTSNAAYSDFIRVELDGKTLDEKNYTVMEGSTIVTLKAEYVATLPAGKHTIGIVSESGTATTTFTVAEIAAAEDSAKTGDSTNLALWFALMLLSGAGITGVTAYTRRKRTNE